MTVFFIVCWRHGVAVILIAASSKNGVADVSCFAQQPTVIDK